MGHKKSNPLFNFSNSPRDLREGLERADLSLSNQNPTEALRELLPLNEKYPHNQDILGLLAFTYQDLQNDSGYLYTMLQLEQLNSNNENYKISVADAYLQNGFPALALQKCRKIITRWPNNTHASEIHSIIQKLELIISDSSSKLGFSLEPGLDFFSKHEEIQVLMSQGNFKRAKQLAQELIELRPEFSPALNNLSKISWLEGNLIDAIELSKKVLTYLPENVHALSSLIIYLFVIGEKSKLPTLTKRLMESKVLATDHWLKKVSALCLIGEDEKVRQLLEQAKSAKEDKHIDGTFWHWCAVSEYRLGNIPKARTYWKKCLKLAPYFNLAADNLEEFKKSPSDRVCPQVFGIETWFSAKLSEDLASIVESNSKKKESEYFKSKLELFFSDHPETLNFIPTVMTAGSTLIREFALDLVTLACDQKTLNWLKTFAEGKDGPDYLRLKAAQILAKQGVYKTGKKVKVWSKGKQIQVILFGFEIEFDAKEKNRLNPQALRLSEKAIAALREHDGAVAEDHIRQAIKIQPNEPSLLNNLAVSLNMQGKKSEAETIADQIEKQYPDYFFGQMYSARKAILFGYYNKAQKILDGLINRKTLHITEFSALCSCQIDLFLATDKYQSAISWYDIWKKISPEDPALERYSDFED